MWIASTKGFFSIVQKTDGFHVRARSKADLANLLEALPLTAAIISDIPGSDYCARVIITDRVQLGSLFAFLADTIEYDNFKNAIHASETQRDKGAIYGVWWADMSEFQMNKLGEGE